MLVWLLSYRHTPSLWPSVDEYVGYYGSVILIGAGLMLVVGLARAGTGSIAREATPMATPPLVAARWPRLLDRLPARLGDTVLALQMEDHYVRVHTAAGNDLVLMRMRDAVAELDGCAGTQVHRSWWVAEAAVVRSVQAGRRTELELSNGLTVPVSRER